MLNTNNKTPIKIAIMEASSQNRAILEFFFSNSGKSVFKESSLEDSSAVIIDYDFPGAKASWEQTYKNSQKPGIILSISEVDIPGAIWIAKPLTTQALIEAGHKIKDIIENNMSIATPAETIQSTETVALSDEPDEALHISEAETKPTVTDTDSDHSSAVEIQSMTDSEPQTTLNNTTESEEELLSPITDDALKVTTVTSDEASTLLDFANLEEAEPVLTESSIATHASSVKNVDHSSTTQINHAIPSVSDFAGNTNFLELDDTTFDENSADKNAAKSDHQAKKVTDDVTEITIPASDTVEAPEQAIDDEEIDALLESLISGGKAKQLDEQVDKITTDYLVDNMPADDAASNNHSDTAQLEPHKKPHSETDLFDFDTISTDLAQNEPSQKKEKIEVKDNLNSQSTDELSVTLEKTEIEETSSVTDKTPVEDKDLFDLEIDSLTTQASDPHQGDVDEVNKFTNDLESSDLIIEEHSSMIFEDLGDTPQAHDELMLDDVLASSDSIDTEAAEKELDNNYLELDPTDLSSETPVEKSLSAEEELQELLEEIRKEAESAQTPGSISVSVSNQQQDHQPSARPNHIPTAAEERWALTCGVNEKIATVKDVDRIAYTLSNHMLSTLLDTLVQSEHTQKVMRLKFKGHIIVVDHANDFIYCDHSIYTNQYAELCHNPIDAESIKVHELDSSEIRLYRKKAEEEPEYAHSIESFIWTTSLLTSRGRLLKYTDINKKVGLKYWPNLTRLELIPHAMQIAAVFYKHPGSLLEVSRWLKIEQRYVFAFYNAVLALKYIELDGNKLRSSSLDMEATSNTKRRGFFSRLLKRIKS